jgi:hypothetical protein
MKRFRLSLTLEDDGRVKSPVWHHHTRTASSDSELQLCCIGCDKCGKPDTTSGSKLGQGPAGKICRSCQF